MAVKYIFTDLGDLKDHAGDYARCRGDEKQLEFHSHGVFGENFEKFESLSESTSTSSYVDKIDATTKTMPIGTYRVGFTIETCSTSPARQVELKFMINGTSIHQHDTGNDELEICCRDTNSWNTSGAFHYITLTTAGTIDLNIQYKDSTFGRVSNASIEIWRVS